jgi:lysozyme family protein
MADLFDEFIERLLSHEGGYVNHPSDPGGETQWGISKRSYPNVNIKTLTRSGAKEIYRRDFWAKSGADKMAPAVAFNVLDGAVNSGISRSIRWLQEAAGVTADGVYGPATAAAVAKADPNDLVLRYNAARLEFMTGLSTWGSFGKGWARRIAANLKFGAEDN